MSRRLEGNGFVTSGTVDSGNAVMIGQGPRGRYREDGEGWIDDLGVWRRASTPLEVASTYIAGAQSSLSFTPAAFFCSPRAPLMADSPLVEVRKPE